MTAFEIDAEKRARLIAEDPNSAELIKPWLCGKDILRWYADWPKQYVIHMHIAIVQIVPTMVWQ